MFHGRPLNQSGVFVPPTSQPPQQQQSWPLTQQEHNNLRASQSGSSPSVQVKFYLPDDEIRRSQIPANCTLQQVTEQIKRYASVADKNLLLAWNDDQNEWIRFDTDSEFNDAMNHARHLLSVNGVFKIQAKEGKTPAKQTTSEPTPVVEQKPIQQPVQPVVQPPIQQPVQPVKPPVTQPPVTQPPVVQPIKPVQPVNPFYPQQPMYTQPPVMSYGQPQPQFQPFSMNQPMMNQPMTQPMTQASAVPRNVSPFATSTPTKTLNNSVTMQQPHPLNSSFSSSSSSSVPSQSPVQQLPVNPPLTQPQVVQPQQTANVDEQKLATLRSFGFPVNDSVLIKALQEANGDINLAVAKMLEQ